MSFCRSMLSVFKIHPLKQSSYTSNIKCQSYSPFSADISAIICRLRSFNTSMGSSQFSPLIIAPDPGREAKYCDERVCVCLRIYLWNYTSNLVRVARGRGQVRICWCCNMLCISGLMDNVIFAHNGQKHERREKWVGLYSK